MEKRFQNKDINKILLTYAPCIRQVQTVSMKEALFCWLDLQAVMLMVY